MNPEPRTLNTERDKLPVTMVQRMERLVGGDPVTEEQILRFIGARYGAKSLVF